MLSVDRKKVLQKLLKQLNIEKTDIELFDVALTHPSFNFERNIENAPDYERLEFLGDSVIRLVMSEYLFDKYLDYDEGNLTKIRSYLVSDEFFCKLAKSLHLNDYLNLGIHEEKDGGREKESIIACSLEAIFGCIYKSVSFDYAKEFIYSLYNKLDLDFDLILHMYNSKELLQQYTQKENKDLPIYSIVREDGLAHEKTYEVEVSYHGKILGKGIAKQKKEAEKIAAFDALKTLNIVKG